MEARKCENFVPVSAQLAKNSLLNYDLIKGIIFRSQSEHAKGLSYKAINVNIGPHSYGQI